MNETIALKEQERINSQKKRIDRRPHFTLQWHVTAKCDQNCAHCYSLGSPTYQSELKNELCHEDCIKIIDDFSKTFNYWGMPTRINFTGGDALLREDIYDLISYAIKKGSAVGILGNPNHLNHETAEKLKSLGVFRYQLSIDGLEETHDKLRGRKGLFKDTLRALQVLDDVGLPSVVMLTLSKVNANELIDIIRMVANKGVPIFDFARLVPFGAGEQLKDQMLTPNEYRALLLKVFEEYKNLQDNECSTYFGRKDHLWKLLYQELGLLKPLPKDKEIVYHGCGIGSCLLTILADGTVYSCRRLPIKIGMVPIQSIRNIFINSPEHNKLRELENLEKCSKCDLMQFCRGCPAVAYGATGDYMAPDPQCWKEV